MLEDACIGEPLFLPLHKPRHRMACVAHTGLTATDTRCGLDPAFRYAPLGRHCLSPSVTAIIRLHLLYSSSPWRLSMGHRTGGLQGKRTRLARHGSPDT